MGGGSSSSTSSQPYDLMGGQYATFSGGTPPAWYQTPQFGSALSSAGSDIAAGSAAPNFMTSPTMGSSPLNLQNPQLSGLIPQAAPQSGESELLAVIQKLLSGSGLLG